MKKTEDEPARCCDRAKSERPNEREEVLKTNRAYVEVLRPAGRMWYNYWPFLIATIIILLNVDGVVIPSLHLRWLSILGFRILDLSHVIPVMSLSQIFLCVIAVSIPGNIFWFWFWGWFGKLVLGLIKNQKKVKEGIELFTEGIELRKEIEPVIQPVLEKKGFLERIREYLTGTFNWATNENNKYLKRLKRGGYTTLFIMAASPEPGGRLAATVLSRTFDSKKGLLSLLFGDTFKNFYMVFGFWNLVLRLPSSYLQIAIVVGVAYFVGSLIYKKIKKRPD